MKALLLSMLIFSNVQAGDKLLSVALALHAADYRQTLDIKNHHGMTETNLILGRKPSNRSIHGYMLATGGMMVLTSRYFDHNMIDLMFIANGLLSVGMNQSIGLEFKF